MSAPASSSSATRATTPSATSRVVSTAGLRAPRPVRSNGRVVLALLLIVAGATIGAALYLVGDSRTQVVVAARDIPVGTLISAEDLTAGEISGGGVSAVAGVDAGRLLGQTATTRIPAGALVHADMVDPAPPPGQGQIAIGLSLTAGQLPAAELAPGRLVEVLQVPTPSEAAIQTPVGTVLVEEALTLSVSADPSGAWLVTISVDRQDAPAVVVAAAEGRATLGLLPVTTATEQADADETASISGGAGVEGEG